SVSCSGLVRTARPSYLASGPPERQSRGNWRGSSRGSWGGARPASATSATGRSTSAGAGRDRLLVRCRGLPPRVDVSVENRRMLPSSRMMDADRKDRLSRGQLSLDQALALTAEHVSMTGFFFDFDGTLAPIEDDPESVQPTDGVLEPLEQISRIVRRV